MPTLPNTRIVFLVRREDKELPSLADVTHKEGGRDLQLALRSIYQESGLRGLSLRLVTSDVFPDDPATATPAGYLRSVPGNGRFAIYPAMPHIPVEPPPHAMQHGFIIAYPNETNTGWQPAGDVWVQASLGLETKKQPFQSQISRLIDDMLLDMSIANASCVQDVLRHAIPALTRGRSRSPPAWRSSAP